MQSFSYSGRSRSHALYGQVVRKRFAYVRRSYIGTSILSKTTFTVLFCIGLYWIGFKGNAFLTPETIEPPAPTETLAKVGNLAERPDSESISVPKTVHANTGATQLQKSDSLDSPLLPVKQKEAIALTPESIASEETEVEVQPVLKAEFKNTDSQPSALLSASMGILGAKILDQLPEIDSEVLQIGEARVHLTLEEELQGKAQELLEKYRVPWGVIVALQPRTGKILALASYSQQEPEDHSLPVRAGFPAASLFKLVTTTAAMEEGGLSSSDPIYYRGGNYTLNRGNYLPDRKRDKRRISVRSALGRSINPAFARIALLYLSPRSLQRYAYQFGFNQDFPLEFPCAESEFSPISDKYDFARTAAGFGDVTVSPLHAAMMVSALANGGKMMAPFMISDITNHKGDRVYVGEAKMLRRVSQSSTAHKVLKAMSYTTEHGTARKYFRRWKRLKSLKNIVVAGKTGTLSGKHPKGRYHWFVGAAPLSNPEIAIAALVIDPGHARIGGSGLAYSLLDYYFRRFRFAAHSKFGNDLNQT